MALFEIRNLTFTYPEAKTPALQEVNVAIEQGEFIVICGKSGCGKTTLLRHFKTALTPYGTRSGEIRFLGDALEQVSVRTQASEIGYVLQSPDNQIVTDKVWHELAFGLESLGYSNADIRIRVAEMASYFGIQDWFYKNVSELSGGQKQRVGIARALTTDPELLLCDEATSALDPQTTESILKLLKKINRKMGVTILLITHQMQVVQMICNKVAVMESGKIVEFGSVLEVFGSPKMPVTKRFVQTVIRDQIPDSIISLVKEQKENFRVDRLKFIGSSVKRPVISDICKTKGVVVNILGAAVQELEDSVMCVFILQLIGDDESIDKAEAEIDKNGVLRERLEVE